MTVIDLRNLPRSGPSHPRLFKTDRLRDALADYLAEQHPNPGRRKAVGQRFGLNADEARSACEGSASPTTLDKIWRAGGWGVVLPVFAKLLAEGVDQHLEREARRHAEKAEQIGGVARNFRSAFAAGPRNRAGERLRLAGGGVPESREMGARQAARPRTPD